jgi:hypothetical protein
LNPARQAGGAASRRGIRFRDVGAATGGAIAWSALDDEFSSRDRSLTAKHTAEGRRARGGGTPFLPPVTEDVPLDLIETRAFGSRVIYERYGRVRDDSD